MEPCALVPGLFLSSGVLCTEPRLAPVCEQRWRLEVLTFHVVESASEDASQENKVCAEFMNKAACHIVKWKE